MADRIEYRMIPLPQEHVITDKELESVAGALARKGALRHGLLVRPVGLYPAVGTGLQAYELQFEWDRPGNGTMKQHQYRLRLLNRGEELPARVLAVDPMKGTFLALSDESDVQYEAQQAGQNINDFVRFAYVTGKKPVMIDEILEDGSTRQAESFETFPVLVSWPYCNGHYSAAEDRAATLLATARLWNNGLPTGAERHLGANRSVRLSYGLR